MPRRRTQVFLKESVILFGFLNGLFVSIGVNPGATLLAVIANTIDSLTGGNGLARLLLTLLPLVLVGLALYLIGKRGGWLGFLAVGLAFVSGLWLLAAPTLATLLLLASLALGVIATR